MSKTVRRLTKSEVNNARKGLNAIVGSPYRKKEIEDGKEGLLCKFCKSKSTPIVSSNGNLNCGECESRLYDGLQDKVM